MTVPSRYDVLNRLGAGQGITPLVLGTDRPPVVTLTNGVTIDSRDSLVLTTNGGAVTGILMRAGERPGQVCVVVNQAAATVTFAAVSTSLVRDGVTSVIKANGAALFVWDGTNWNSII